MRPPSGGVDTAVLSYLVASMIATGAALTVTQRPPRARAAQNVTAVDPFNVTSFVAQAVVMSYRVLYAFQVSTCPGAEPVGCQVLGTSMTESLGSVPLSYCGEAETGVMWEFNRLGDGGAELVVVRNVSRLGSGAGASVIINGGGGGGGGAVTVVLDEAVRSIPANDMVIMGEGLFSHEVYVGPENFSIPAYSFTT